MSRCKSHSSNREGVGTVKKLLNESKVRAMVLSWAVYGIKKYVVQLEEFWEDYW